MTHADLVAAIEKALRVAGCQVCGVEHHGRFMRMSADGYEHVFKADYPALAALVASWVGPLIESVNIETLRQYHELSFADPPSYHYAQPISDLWNCPQCVERYMERSRQVLSILPWRQEQG